jgi:hypothetical protein
VAELVGERRRHQRVDQGDRAHQVDHVLKEMENVNSE